VALLLKCDDALRKFESDGLVQITEEKYLGTNDAYDVIDELFGADTMEQAFQRAIELESYKMKNHMKDYPVNMIPVQLFREKNEELDEALDDWHDGFFAPWWNTNGSDMVLRRWIKKVGKEMNATINEYKLRRHYYPNPLPEKIQLFRGLKTEFNPNHKKIFTSWTLSEDQGKRFATYHFSQGYTTRPHESDIQILLETNVSLDEIVVFIGGDEYEVILKEPVEIEKIRRLK
jgi:hypothetical protein